MLEELRRVKKSYKALKELHKSCVKQSNIGPPKVNIATTPSLSNDT